MAMAGLSYAVDARSVALRHGPKVASAYDAQVVSLRRSDALLPHPECCGLVAVGRGGAWKGAARGLAVARLSDMAVEKAEADAAAGDVGKGWREFAESVSGEWDGYGAEFTSNGEVVELPSAVVPQAFKEWEVQIFDWQTQCPSLAQADESDFWYKVIRLLPTVGCEADAATQYSLERRSVEEDAAVLFAFQRNGSYTAVWPGTAVLTAGVGSSAKVVARKRDVENAWEVEHCFVEDGPERGRMRILLQFVGWTPEAEGKKLPLLKKVTIYAERWDGPFRNGESFGSCGTKGSAFASSAKLDASAVQGNWSGQTFSAGRGPASDVVSRVKELQAVKYEQISRDVEGVISLPKGMWYRLQASDGASFIVEAGWVFKEDKAFVARCDFTAERELEAVHTRIEQRDR